MRHVLPHLRQDFSKLMVLSHANESVFGFEMNGNFILETYRVVSNAEKQLTDKQKCVGRNQLETKNKQTCKNPFRFFKFLKEKNPRMSKCSNNFWLKVKIRICFWFNWPRFFFLNQQNQPKSFDIWNRTKFKNDKTLKEIQNFGLKRYNFTLR